MVSSSLEVLSPKARSVMLICSSPEAMEKQPSTTPSASLFCHQFDLTARLEPRHAKGQLLMTPLALIEGQGQIVPQPNLPTHEFLLRLADTLRISKTDLVHRVIMPNFLSPILYPPESCRPSEVVQFLHGLRALLRQYPDRLSAMMTLSTALHPRSSGLVRWAETINDGVIEMIPIQQPVHTQPGAENPGNASQGILQIHRMPVYSERGGGSEGKALQEDLSFKLSSTDGVVIKLSSLPPVGDLDPPGERSPRKPTEPLLSF